MNEGENLGFGSNPSGQIDNPGPIISNTPETQNNSVSTSGASNNSKFFGGRSRYNANRFAQRSDVTNFAAAQNIASNPNTPQFFSDAVMESTPVPVEKPRTNKMPIIIGAVVVVLLIIAGIIGTIMMSNGGGAGGAKDGEIPLANIDDIITRDMALKASDLESDYMKIINHETEDLKMFSDSYIKTAKENLEAYRTIAQTFEKYKSVQGQDKLNRNIKVEMVGKKMREALPVYEKLVKNLEQINQAYKGKIETSGVEDEDSRVLLERYMKAEKTFKAQDKLRKQNGCDNEDIEQTAICKQISDTFEEAEEALRFKSEEVTTFYLGSTDVDSLKTRQISDDLMDIMAYIGEVKTGAVQ